MADEAAVRRLAVGCALPLENLSAILDRTRAALKGDQLPLEDAAAIAYLTCALQSPAASPIKHVLVDEGQDYGALDYAVLNRLYPRARFTVLGDVNQALGRRADLSLYDEIARLFNRRTSALVTLNKSFRCTREILAFSLRYLDDPTGIESFSRAGEPPTVHLYRDAADAAEQIGAEIVAALVFFCEERFRVTIRDERVSGFHRLIDLVRWVEALRADGRDDARQMGDAERAGWYYE